MLTNRFTYYFYCPNCGNQDIVDKLPEGTVANIRDGFGTPIYHSECSKCHNLDAGFMFSMNKYITADDVEYFKSRIEMYQNIRGFNIPKE